MILVSVKANCLRVRQIDVYSLVDSITLNRCSLELFVEMKTNEPSVATRTIVIGDRKFSNAAANDTISI